MSETKPVSYFVTKPIIQNKPPSGRGGATTIYADGKLVVFGGHYFAGNDKFEYCNETWLFDLEKLNWHKISCSGEIPGPRYGHSAHMLGSRMFIFGGKGPGETVYKDVYFLDMMEWVWVPVNTISACPKGRFFHASELVGRKIVVQGGYDGMETFDDIWIFNTDSFVWSQPRTTGFGPSPRYGHTLTLTPDGRLLTFGGCSFNKDTGVPVYLNDVRQLDTDTMIWTRPRVAGEIPTGRYGHSVTLMSDGKLFMYGGWGKGGCQDHALINDAKAFATQVLDTRTMTWLIPRKSTPKAMKHLYNHSACKASSSNILFWGGFDGRQALNEFYVVTLDGGEGSGSSVVVDQS